MGGKLWIPSQKEEAENQIYTLHEATSSASVDQYIRMQSHSLHLLPALTCCKQRHSFWAMALTIWWIRRGCGWDGRFWRHTHSWSPTRRRQSAKSCCSNEICIPISIYFNKCVRQEAAAAKPDNRILTHTIRRMGWASFWGKRWQTGANIFVSCRVAAQSMSSGQRTNQHSAWTQQTNAHTHLRTVVQADCKG
jgi:hypothetical protein